MRDEHGVFVPFWKSIFVLISICTKSQAFFGKNTFIEVFFLSPDELLHTFHREKDCRCK